MVYLQLFGGLIYLLMGGDLLVRGAVALARRARVSPVAIALSVVAFGTSLPELVVTLHAVLDGYPGIAVGNVVGSNIANALLVVGAPAILYPLAITESTTRRNSVVMFGVSVMFVALCFLGDLGRPAGVVLLVSLVILGGLVVRESARDQRQADRSLPMEWVLGLPSRTWMIVLFLIAGTIGLPLGAGMLVEAAVQVAEQLRISDAVVGLTIVALGTSLPELATCVVAALRRESGVALGTALGSNVFNIVAIMGLAAVVAPAPIRLSANFLSMDLPVMLGAALLLTILAWRRRPIGRLAGMVLVLGYCAYLAVLFSSA